MAANNEDQEHIIDGFVWHDIAESIIKLIEVQRPYKLKHRALVHLKDCDVIILSAPPKSVNYSDWLKLSALLRELVNQKKTEK